MNINIKHLLFIAFLGIALGCTISYFYPELAGATEFDWIVKHGVL